MLGMGPGAFRMFWPVLGMERQNIRFSAVY